MSPAPGGRSRQVAAAGTGAGGSAHEVRATVPPPRAAVPSSPMRDGAADPAADAVADAVAATQAAFDRLQDREGAVRVARATLSESVAAAPRQSPAVAAAAEAVQAAQDAAAAAASAARVTEDRLEDREAAVRVARAKLNEAVQAAPQLSPAITAAEEAVAIARETVSVSTLTHEQAVRGAEDRAGAVRVAKAKLDDLDGSIKPVKLGDQVAADERHDKAIRDETAAQEHLDRAMQAADEARQQLTTAIAHRDAALAQPRADTGRVVAAREALHKAERDRDAGREQVRSAARESERAAQQLTAAQEQLENARTTPETETARVITAREALQKAERDRDAAQVQYAAARETMDRVQQATTAQAEEPARRQHFQSLEEFVVDYLLENWERASDVEDKEPRWCARWWEHPEAVSRLEALWEAFESARRDPAPAMSSWWRDHVDHHMAVLTGPYGPFERCHHLTGEHHVLPPWHSVPADDGVFADNYESETALERRVVRDLAARQAQRATHQGTQTMPDSGASEADGSGQPGPASTSREAG